MTYTVAATIPTQPIAKRGNASAFLDPLLGFLKRGPGGDYAQAYLYRVALPELRRIGPRAGQALPLLIAIFTDNATATLHALLTNKDLSGTYRPTILTLRKLGPNRQGVMPALTASLAYDREYRALNVFGEWGPQGRRRSRHSNEVHFANPTAASLAEHLLKGEL